MLSPPFTPQWEAGEGGFVSPPSPAVIAMSDLFLAFGHQGLDLFLKPLGSGLRSHDAF
jgi:hypothetical protein